MQEIIKLNYQGLGQLLASSPWAKSKRQLSQSCFSRVDEETRGAKTIITGFTPYKKCQNYKISHQIQSDPDSQRVENDSQSSSCDQTGKNGTSQQKKKQNQNGRTRKGPYKKYTTEQKRQATQLINSGKDIKTVSKQFNIPRRNLLRWRKNGCERKQGGGRPSDFVMEEKLFDKIIHKQITTEKQIRQYALAETNFKKFKASKGWYVKFWRRFHEYRQRISKKQAVLEIKVQQAPAKISQ